MRLTVEIKRPVPSIKDALRRTAACLLSLLIGISPRRAFVLGLCIAIGALGVLIVLHIFPVLYYSCDDRVKEIDEVPSSCASEYRARAEAGDARAAGLYADYLLGGNKESALEEGRRWLQIAASKGYVPSIFRAAYLCERNIGGFNPSSVKFWVQAVNKPGNDVGTSTAVKLYSGEQGCILDLEAAGLAMLQYDGHDCSVATAYSEKMLAMHMSWKKEVREAVVRALLRCATREATGAVNAITNAERDELVALIQRGKP